MINKNHKIENNLGYFEKNGDFINELWAVPSYRPVWEINNPLEKKP